MSPKELFDAFSQYGLHVQSIVRKTYNDARGTVRTVQATSIVGLARGCIVYLADQSGDLTGPPPGRPSAVSEGGTIPSFGVVPDCTLEQLVDQLCALASWLGNDKRLRIEEARENCPGGKVAYVENWPLTVCVNEELLAIKLTERGEAFEDFALTSENFVWAREEQADADEPAIVEAEPSPGR